MFDETASDSQQDVEQFELTERQKEVEEHEAEKDTFSITERCRKRVVWAEQVVAYVRSNLEKNDSDEDKISSLTSVFSVGELAQTGIWCSDYQQCTKEQHSVCTAVKNLHEHLESYQQSKIALAAAEQQLAAVEPTQSMMATTMPSTSTSTNRSDPPMDLSEQELRETENQLAEAKKQLEEAENQLAEAKKQSEECNNNNNNNNTQILHLLSSMVERNRMIVEMLVEKDRIIVEKDRIIVDIIVEKDRIIVEKDRSIVEKDRSIVEKDRIIVDIIVEKDSSIVEKACVILTEKANGLLLCHDMVRTCLMTIASAGNRTQYTLGTQNNDKKETTERLSFDSTRFTVIPKAPGRVPDLLNNCKELQVPDTSKDKISRLNHFRVFLQEFFKKCSTLDEGDPDYDDSIKETVKVILSWENGRLLPRKSKKYIRPSSVAQETKGVQPVLLAIIRKITTIFDLGNQITRDQFIPETDYKSKRFVDAMSNTDMTEHVRAAAAAFLGNTIEMKPLSRKDETFDKLVQSGENQSIGHCTQILLDRDFDFGAGLGRNGKVHGMVLTLISIEIIEVELVNVGTTDVNLVIRKTGHLPFFDKDTSIHLLGLNDTTDPDAKLKNLSWPEDESLPKGLDGLLWFLQLKTCTEPLKDFQYDVAGEDGLTLRNYLGSGAFSHVYCAGDEIIVKIPKSVAAVKTLQNELNVLRYLGPHKEDLPSPYYDRESLTTLNLAKGCERTHISCLPLKAHIGETALDAMAASTKDQCGDLLKIIIAKVEKVLVYIHKKKVFHLDIQPSNIIVSTNQIVQLIDWGCSHKANDGAVRYRGCPPYSHSALLEQESGKTFVPEAKHDNASFAFTVAHLAKNTKAVPWPNCYKVQLDPTVLQERYEIAKDILSKHMQNNVGNKLIEYIRPEERTSEKRERPISNLPKNGGSSKRRRK